MNDSKMSESSRTSKGRSFDVISEYYDRFFFKTDNLSLVKLMLYTPLGISFVLARLVLLGLLLLLLCLMPALKSSPVLIRLVCFALGIVTRVESLDDSKSDKPRIYVSNHITCFDYVSLKSVVSESSYLEERLMNRNLTCKRATHDIVSGSLTKLLQYDPPKDTDNIYSDGSQFPFIFFPELIATNGNYGVLKFDPKPFSLEQESMKVAVVPVALKATRPFVPLSLNWLGSNDLINMAFMLFTPFTIYKMKFFPEQFIREGETSELFADRVQRIVANGLQLVCSNLDRENIRQMWSDYEKNQQEQQEEQSRRQERHRVDAQSGDIGRVVSQVKSVLPHISYEIVREHVILTSSSDVDTVITSILDAGVSLEQTAAADVSPTANATTPTKSAKAASAASPGKFQSYESRKATLLSEARSRYLAKHQASL